MNNERIREGATIQYTLTDSDLTAQSAVMTISQDDDIKLTATGSYTTVDGKRVVTLTADNDLSIGVYDIMFTVTYSDGFIAKIPESSDCDDGDCGLPTLTVCDANDVEAA